MSGTRPPKQPSTPVPRRPLWLRIVESLGALLLVLVCFLVFFALLGVTFPEGTSLGQLMGLQQSAGRTTAGGAFDVELPGDAARVPLIASLTSVINRVKDKSPGEFVWNDSHAGTPLEDRHAIQTLWHSGAVIQFDPDNLLELKEKSLLILKNLEQEPDSGRQHASLIIFEGALAARIAPRGGRRMALAIDTGNGELRVDAGETSPADFAVRVHDDRSSTFAVYEGSAEVSAGGKIVRIAADHSLTVDPSGVPGRPVRLPGRPDPRSPADGFAAYYRAQPRPVRFDWAAAAEAERHRIVIARDSDFREVVHDGVVDGDSFTHGYLKEGRYYWRLSALRGQAESSPGAVRVLDVVRDTEPPSLRVDFDAAGAPADTLRLSGVTEPGARIFVADRSVETDAAGRFVYDLPVMPGVRIVVVEAVDAAGNVSYQSRLLNAKL